MRNFSLFFILLVTGVPAFAADGESSSVLLYAALSDRDFGVNGA